MRTHVEIIADAGGPGPLARLVQDHVEAEPETVRKRVNAWASSGSIPGEYWQLLDRLNVARVDELATAAAVRKNVSIPQADAA